MPGYEILAVCDFNLNLIEVPFTEMEALFSNYIEDYFLPVS
jgi:hypothetical protein